ncbi:MAG: hypothetical protein AAFV29_15630, partial [Myxococcota bacterium]
MVGGLAFFGCVRPEAPRLPRLVDVAQRSQPGRASLPKGRIQALYVVPRGTPPLRVHPEDRSLRFIEMVSVLDVDGALHINDVVHGGMPQAYSYAKIPVSSIQVSSVQGELATEGLTYTPHRDVRIALDTGHRIRVALLGKKADVVLAPRYDIKDYAPYRAEAD